MTRARRFAATQTLQRIAKAAIAASAGSLLAGCELLAYFDPPPPAPQTTQIALGPAPMPPPPRPGRASRLQNGATPKPPPVAPMPARPRIAVTSEPVPPAPPAPAAAEPPVPRAAAAIQGGSDNAPLRPPPPRIDIDPASLVGRSEAQLEQTLGKALRHERIASGVNWIYDRADCHASFLLLPEVTSGERRVFAYEITPRGNDAPSAAACLGRIAADGQPRRT